MFLQVFLGTTHVRINKLQGPRKAGTSTPFNNENYEF